MNAIINYFETISSSHRGLILASGIAFFWLIENAKPFVKFEYNKWKHAGINIFFTITTIIVNFCLAFLLLKAANYTTLNKFGLFAKVLYELKDEMGFGSKFQRLPNLPSYSQKVAV
jgi:hypothetical protein